MKIRQVSQTLWLWGWILLTFLGISLLTPPRNDSSVVLDRNLCALPRVELPFSSFLLIIVGASILLSAPSDRRRICSQTEDD